MTHCSLLMHAKQRLLIKRSKQKFVGNLMDINYGNLSFRLSMSIYMRFRWCVDCRNESSPVSQSLLWNFPTIFSIHQWLMFHQKISCSEMASMQNDAFEQNSSNGNDINIDIDGTVHLVFKYWPKTLVWSVIVKWCYILHCQQPDQMFDHRRFR